MNNITTSILSLDCFVSEMEQYKLRHEYKLFKETLSPKIRNKDYNGVCELITDLGSKYYFGRKVISHIINHVFLYIRNDGSLECQKLLNTLVSQFNSACFKDPLIENNLNDSGYSIKIENLEEYELYSNLMYDYLELNRDTSAYQITMNLSKLSTAILDYCKIGSMLGCRLGMFGEMNDTQKKSLDEFIRINGLDLNLFKNQYEEGLSITYQKPDYSVSIVLHPQTWEIEYKIMDYITPFSFLFDKNTSTGKILSKNPTNSRILIRDNNFLDRELTIETSDCLIETFTEINNLLNELMLIVCGRSYFI